MGNLCSKKDDDVPMVALTTDGDESAGDTRAKVHLGSVCVL